MSRLDHSKKNLWVLWNLTLTRKMRIIFRLCEYSQGLDSKIPLHEAYQYCLDSLPMLLALVILNIVHPGRIMPGTGSEVPSRKERKKMSIDTKARPLGDDMVCLVECSRSTIPSSLTTMNRCYKVNLTCSYT